MRKLCAQVSTYIVHLTVCLFACCVSCLLTQSIGYMQQYVYAFIVAERIMTRVIRP